MVWEMKNALVNSSHTALFVGVGTKPNSKLLTCNTFTRFWFSSLADFTATETNILRQKERGKKILNCFMKSQWGRVWVRFVCFLQASMDTHWVFVSPPTPHSPTCGLETVNVPEI